MNDPNLGPVHVEKNENALSVQSMRQNWIILEGSGVGVTIYKTPAGIFRAQEMADGTLVRLERMIVE